MSWGLDATGFTRMRLPDLEAEIKADIEAVFGPVNWNDDGNLRQLVGIFAERMATLWELAEGVYLGLYPASAEGAQLDDVATLAGLTRIAAEKSTAVIAATGTQGTVVPAATQVEASSTDDVFETDGPVTIDIADAIRADITVTTPAADTFTVTIDGVAHNYVAGGGETAIQIAAGLVAAIAASTVMTATDNLDGSFYLTSDDNETGYPVLVSTLGGGVLTITSRASPIPVTALVAGRVLVSAAIIDDIVTPVAGLSAVTNPGAGIQGRDLETDAELRLRIHTAKLGAATVEAIRTRIFDEVDGVSAVVVVENATDAYVGLQPPHSIQCVVQGGTDALLAAKIWEVKPAGIATYGADSEVIVDGAGNNQTVYFTRPTPQYAWVRIRYTRYTEETINADADNAIETAILAAGNAYEIGEDLLWQRFLPLVFATTPGIASATVELDLTAAAIGPPVYVMDTDVPVAATELAIFDAARIDVAEV